MSEDSKLTVNLYRDGSIESSHEVNLYSNKKQYDDYFFPRSSVKPMQVIPLLIEASNQNIEFTSEEIALFAASHSCLLYTSPSPRDRTRSRMPSSA